MQPEEHFLHMVIAELVEYPTAVHIERTTDERGVLLSLDLHKNDMGKVIGKDGAVAHAIRTLLRSVGMKHGARVNLKIKEPESIGQQNAREAFAAGGIDA